MFPLRLTVTQLHCHTPIQLLVPCSNVQFWLLYCMQWKGCRWRQAMASVIILGSLLCCRLSGTEIIYFTFRTKSTGLKHLTSPGTLTGPQYLTLSWPCVCVCVYTVLLYHQSTLYTQFSRAAAGVVSPFTENLPAWLAITNGACFVQYIIASSTIMKL